MAKKIKLCFPINFFLFTTAMFFAPMEVFRGNINDFTFSQTHIWWILLAFCILSSALLSLLEALLPAKLCKLAVVGSFALGLCFYIQGMLLNGKMTALAGHQDNYSASTIVGNLLIWVLIAAAVFTAYYAAVKKGRFDADRVIVFVALAIVVMQSAGLVSLLVTGTGKSNFMESGLLVEEGKLELSRKNNCLVFIVDTCDGKYMETALQEDPKLFDALDGFTYYPNCTSTYSRTYPAIPYLLTDKKCFFEIPYEEQLKKMYSGSEYLELLCSGCDDIRVYTDSGYLGLACRDKVDNYYTYDNTSLSGVNIGGALYASYRVGLYRAAPYLAKRHFTYYAEDIDAGIMNYERLLANVPSENFFEDDLAFYRGLEDTGLRVNRRFDSAFRFYHMLGAHADSARLDENFAPTEHPTPIQGTRRSFKLIGEYVSQLKKLGLYDSSTIIITADHGKSNDLQDTTDIVNKLFREEAAPCVMLVKPAGADSSVPCKISQAPVCHADIFPTILKAFGIEADGFGLPIYEIPDDAERERTYYYTAYFRADQPEIALREYLINGDAADFSSWRLSGRNWNIDYGVAAFSSKERLSDYEPDAVIAPVPTE